MRLFTIAALGLAAGGCGGIYDYRSPVDTIGYEAAGMSGRTATWRIDKEGDVAFTSFEPVRDNNPQQQGATRRFSVGKENYFRIDALMRKLASYRGGARHPRDYAASREIPCDSDVTDMPHVTVTWENPVGALQLARVDFGCRSAQAAAIQADLREADRLIQEWAASASRPAG